MIRRIVLASLAALALAGCGVTEDERYADTCHDRGGFVSRDNSKWNTEYACVAQTSGPQLPPFQR